MKVLELDPAKRVVWEVTDGPAEWIGTTVRWGLQQLVESGNGAPDPCDLKSSDWH